MKRLRCPVCKTPARLRYTRVTGFWIILPRGTCPQCKDAERRFSVPCETREEAFGSWPDTWKRARASAGPGYEPAKSKEQREKDRRLARAERERLRRQARRRRAQD